MEESSRNITVSTPGIIFATFFETLLPFVLAFIWIRKNNGKIYYILIGIGGFISSVLIESIFISLITKKFGKDSSFLTLITVISPGLFEETGKYLMIKYIYSKEKIKNNSVSYGIGHGGIESFMIGMSLLANIFAKDTLIEKGVLKKSINFSFYLMSAFERLFAITLQISLSILNYKANKDKKIIFYFYAIILHDFIDLFAILYQKGILESIYIVELIIGFLSFSIFYCAYNLYINMDEKEKEKIQLDNKKESSGNKID